MRMPTLARSSSDSDLDYICANLQDEFGRMAGKRLLITGGAGFLGYYLVQAALHFNQHGRQGSRSDVTVWDNFIRGTPAVADAACAATRNLASSGTT